MRRRCSIRNLLLLLLTMASLVGKAQQEAPVFSGVVMDSVEQVPLEKCTITLSHAKGQGSKRTTDAKGRFSLPVTHDSSVLLVQHVGYTEKRFVLRLAQLTKKTDTIYLLPADRRLDDIVVKAKVPPVVIRDDTTEFHIDSAMFEPFDVVEDLVKRLPGLQIDADGKMSFHGKPITRILVDGEELFVGDPNFSMKKLPAGLVSKIQVMDTKTLEQLFNGTPPDGEDKTLNIKLKPGNKTFGNGDAMAGTSNLLEGNATLSQFDGSKRISINGSGNTSNNMGLLKRRAGPASSFVSAGLNYGNAFGKLRVNGGYSYNQNGNRNQFYRERTQLITADTSFFTQSRSYSDYLSHGHQANMSMNWFIDSSSHLDLTLQYNKGGSRGNSISSSTTLENGDLRNASLNDVSSIGSNESVRGSITWLKRLNRKGRRFSFSARMNHSDQDNDQLSQSTNTYFKTGLPLNGDTLHRRIKNLNRNSSHSVRIIYTEPISKNLYFDASGEFEMNRSATDRTVSNLDSVTKTAVYDSVYSAAIRSSTNTQTLTSSVSYRKENINLTAGFSTVLQQALRTLQGEEIRQHLLRYAPSVTASYTFAKRKTLRASFSGNTIQPTIEQLQPVPDNSNPLYIRIGNPDLRTAFSQNYGLSYSANDFTEKRQQTFTANLSYAPVSNQIINAVYYDQYRRQTSQYINVNGVYSLRSGLALTRNWQKEKITQGWSVGSGFNWGQQVYFQNNQPYHSRDYSATLNLSVNRRKQAVRAPQYNLNVNTSYGRNWTPADLRVLNTTRFSISPQLDGGANLFPFLYFTGSYRVTYSKLDYHSLLRRNDEYSQHFVNTDFRFQLAKKFFCNAAVSYQYNTRVPDGMPKGIVNGNFSATGQVMKGRGQLVFTAVDLFAPGTSLRRTVGDNFIEDAQVDNLRNYFTLKFQYNFSKLEKRERVISGK